MTLPTYLPPARLREAAIERAGSTCEWPGCDLPWEEMAHLQHRGMGGRPSANTLDNVAMLCRHHHHGILDGEGDPRLRRFEVRVLLAAYLRAARPTETTP
jgi:hypothetical protein